MQVTFQPFTFLSNDYHKGGKNRCWPVVVSHITFYLHCVKHLSGFPTCWRNLTNSYGVTLFMAGFNQIIKSERCVIWSKDLSINRYWLSNGEVRILNLTIKQFPNNNQYLYAIMAKSIVKLSWKLANWTIASSLKSSPSEPFSNYDVIKYNYFR